MNDVKLSNVELAARQGPQASSSPPDPVQGAQESIGQSSKVRQQEVNEAQKQQSSGQAEASRESVENAVTQLNDYVQSVQRDLRFQLDDISGKTVISVLDQNSEVVRQIPDDVALRLARDLQQDEPLSLFDAKV